MTNKQHQELVDAGRGHLSPYSVRPDPDDVVAEYKELVRQRLAQQRRDTEK